MISGQTLKNISQLDYISVREKDLQEYLVGAVKKSVSLVVDPGFLLAEEKWEKLLPNKKHKDKFGERDVRRCCQSCKIYFATE